MDVSIQDIQHRISVARLISRLYRSTSPTPHDSPGVVCISHSFEQLCSAKSAVLTGSPGASTTVLKPTMMHPYRGCNRLLYHPPCWSSLALPI